MIDVRLFYTSKPFFYFVMHWKRLVDNLYYDISHRVLNPSQHNYLEKQIFRRSVN